MTGYKPKKKSAAYASEKYIEMGAGTVTDWQRAVHALAVAKGWHPKMSKTEKMARIPERLALIHSEVSEALEAYRSGEEMWMIDLGPNEKPVGFASELADVVIRVLDLAQELGINIESVMKLKHDYNKTRSYRHGGKKV